MGFQQGLSGLNAASKNLDVIGHNIANANTTGFKASRAEFADMVASAIGRRGRQQRRHRRAGERLYSSSRRATSPSPATRWTSPSTAAAFHAAAARWLGAYTRAGNFKLDKNGDLRTNSGARVLGYPIDPATGLRTATVPGP